MEDTNTPDLSERHGGPRDRGRADAWYSRSNFPHKYEGDTHTSEHVILTNPEEIAAYNEGYNGEGERKDWG